MPEASLVEGSLITKFFNVHRYSALHGCIFKKRDNSMISYKQLIPLIVFFNIAHLISNNQINREKFVIGTHIERGFFSAVMLALSGIKWCLENNKIPVVYWDNSSPYYQPEGYLGKKNVWEYYFKQVSNLNYEDNDIIHKLMSYPTYSLIDQLYNNKNNLVPGANPLKLKLHALAKQYLRINISIKNKIDNFYNQNMRGKVTVGIHLRGTDKHTEINQVSLESIFKEANKHVCDQYFIATDEERFIIAAKKHLKKDVIYYPSIRSSNNSPLHYSNSSSKAQLGEEVLIEAQLLSKCFKMIHTASAVSLAAIAFNPFIHNIFLSSL